MQTKFQQGRFGYAYKNGKLYHFDNRHVLVMRGWPHPLAWLKRRSHNWRHDRKFAAELMLQNDGLFWSSSWSNYLQKWREDHNKYSKLLPAVEEYQIKALERDYAAIDLFRASFPEYIFREARRYGSRRWHMLCLFSRCPGALDLSVSNPALAFALANNWAFRKPKPTKPMRAARSLVFHKQKKILEWLGFPGTESVRRIFTKISPTTLTVEVLLQLRAALKSEANHKLLTHLPTITPFVVGLIVRKKCRAYLGDKIISHFQIFEKIMTEVSKAREDIGALPKGFGQLMAKSQLSFIQDTIHLLTSVQGHRFSRPFRSLKELKVAHDELSQMQLKQGQNKFDHLHFPPPPYAGTTNIVPISTPTELHSEGSQQHHCCFSFVKKVARGGLYFYRVFHPVRATLLIKRKANRWIFQEIRRADNELVPDELRENILKSLFLSENCGDTSAEHSHNQELLLAQL